MVVLLAGLAVAGDLPTVSDWCAELGDPGRPVAEVAAARGADEPLMLYWMAVRAVPLGVGPPLPGTLVANFDATADPGDSVLRDFTFLAVATPDEVAVLRGAVASWVTAERDEVRAGGTFHVVDLALPDARTGSMSIRQTPAGEELADGRPSPTLWVYLGPR